MKGLKKVVRQVIALCSAVTMCVTLVPEMQAQAAEEEDVTPPVLESFEFEDEGSSVRPGDEITIRFTAYDDESEIEYVEVMIRREGHGDLLREKPEPTGNQNEYRVSFELDEDFKADTYTIDYISLYNTMGKCAAFAADVDEVYPDEYDSVIEFPSVKGTFIIEPEGDQYAVYDVAIGNITLEKDGQTVTVDDSDGIYLDIRIEAECNDESLSLANTTATPIFYLNGNMDEEIYLGWREGLEYNETEKAYIGTISVDAYDDEGLYMLGGIKIENEYDEGRTYRLNQKPSYTLVIDEKLKDKEDPVITGITIDKQGQTINAGTTVTITVEAKDNVGIVGDYDRYGNTNYVTLEGEDGNTIEKTLYEKDGVFQTVIDTSDMAVGEWNISDIWIHDEIGHYSDVDDYMSGYSATRPDYFIITGETVGQVSEENIKLYVPSVNSKTGEIDYIEDKEITVSTAKRTTLGELLGDTYDDYPTFKDAKFIGWSDGDCVFDRDTEIFVNGLYDYWEDYGKLYAAYDVNYTTVEYYYLNNNGELCSQEVEVAAPQGTTVGEVVQMSIPQVEHGSDYGFKEWDFYQWNAERKITKQGNSYCVYALYEKLPITVQMAYLNTQGEWKTTTKQLSLPSGTTASEVNELLEAPENNKYNFVRWTNVTGYKYDSEISLCTLDWYVTGIYENYPIKIRKYYVDKNGETKIVTDTVDGTADNVVYDYIKDIKTAPEDSVDGFTGWTCMEGNGDWAKDGIVLFADYEDWTLYEKVMSYYNKDDEVDFKYSYIYYQNTISTDEIAEIEKEAAKNQNLDLSNSVTGWDAYVSNYGYRDGCGYISVWAVVDETGSTDSHKWDTEYTVDKEPTYTEKGSKSIHCSHCDETKDAVEIPMLSGLAPEQNGVRYYYENGAVKTSLTTLVKDNGTWYYVETGVVSGKYTGLVKYNGSWFYVKNSKVDFSYTGLCKYNGSWYYVEKGVLNWDYTGLCQYNGSWYYVEKGVLNWDYTGLCKYGSSWYYVQKGVLNWNYTGLCKYGSTWYYVQKGVLNWNYTGLCKYGSTWYYVQKGVLNWNYTGLCKYGSTWYYVQKGVLNWNYTGLCKYGSTWYYVQKGVLNWNYTGLCKYGSTWYYVQKGVLNWNYTGLCKYGSTWYYVQKGILNWNYTGLCKYGSSWYYVEKGVLNWNYTGLCKYGSTWYYVQKGVLNWKYTGYTNYGGSRWYVKNGVMVKKA